MTLLAPKEMTWFGFLASDNGAAGLLTDVGGQISGSDITVPLPDGVAVNALKASFEHTGINVLVGVEVQVAGSTPQDFTVVVDYTVTANDGSTRVYSVTAAATPLAPSGVVLSNVTAVGMDVGWVDNSTNATGFSVQRKKTAGGTWITIAEVPTDTTSYSDDGLVGNVEYFYRVSAANAVGNSAWSAEASDVTKTYLIEGMATPDNDGQYPTIELDASGYPHIVQWNQVDGSTPDRIDYTWWDGASWSTETVPVSGYVGMHSSSGIPEHGTDAQPLPSSAGLHSMPHSPR